MGLHAIMTAGSEAHNTEYLRLLHGSGTLFIALWCSITITLLRNLSPPSQSSKTTSTWSLGSGCGGREDGTRGSVHFDLSPVTRSKASEKKQTFEISLQSGRCHLPRKADCKQKPGARSLPTEPDALSPTSSLIVNTTTSETSASSLLGLDRLFDRDPSIAHEPDARPQHQAILLTNLCRRHNWQSNPDS